MKPRPFILRFAAFFLLLVFSQKAGAGLFLHNLFHSSAVNNKIPGEHKTENNPGYSCTCVDDFLMPFTGSGEIAYSIPILPIASPVSFFEEHILFYTSILSFLRGPPVSLA